MISATNRVHQLAKHRQNDVVSGYEVFKAAARATSGPKVRSTAGKGAESTEKADSIAKGGKIGSHIGHTAMPTKHEIKCFTCGYEFQIAGTTKSIFCAKCRAEIPMGDVDVNERSAISIKTGGNVTIGNSGNIVDGVIMATDVEVRGRITGGSVTAARCMNVGPGAELAEAFVTFTDLLIREGALFVCGKVLHVRNVECRGTLTGEIRAKGNVTIQPGGLVEGILVTDHLVIKEGGGLKASVSVRAGTDKLPKKKSKATKKTATVKKADQLELMD